MARDESKGSRQADHWQRKYYDSLEELEEKEKEWQGLESILRILVARLTLISATEDKQLEKKLDRLRDGMRSDRKLLRLAPQIEEVSSFIVQNDSKKKAVATENPAEILGELLDEIKIPKSLQRQEKHVRKKLDKASSERDIPELIKDMAELLGLTIEQATESADTKSKETGEKKPGLLKSLFGDRETDSQQASEQEKSDADDDSPAGDRAATTELTNKEEISSQQEEADHSKRSEPEPEFEAVDETDEPYPPERDGEDDTVEYMEALSVRDIAYAGEILIQLLEQMELPNDLCVEAGLIRQRLEPCDKHEILQKGLESTVALVADAHTRALNEKKEMEHFLQQLTDRLHEIDKSLQETVRLRSQSASATQGMNDAIREEVRNIEESAEKARDLESLQTAIQSRVIIIRDHMDKFISDEQTRDKTYKNLAIRLKQKLDSAESEIESLRERLEQERAQSMVDVVTELANRKAYDEKIDNEIEQYNQTGTAFSLIVIDIDNFKSINDKYGHAAGDKVLRIIAKVIRDNSRESDLPSRYGGEEFVVILPDTEVEQTLAQAEKIRQAIEQCGFHFRKKRVVITASLGLANSQPADTPATIFQRADTALYQAKAAGKNRCEIAS